MNKCILLINTLLVLLLSIVFTGCERSDPETEKIIEGSWECRYFEKEDGDEIEIVRAEEYMLNDHTFSSINTVYGIDDYERVYIFTLRYRGTWMASKSQLINTIDPESIEISGNASIFNRGEITKLKNDLLKDLKKSRYKEAVEIKNVTSDSFLVEDDEGEIIKYERVY